MKPRLCALLSLACLATILLGCGNSVPTTSPGGPGSPGDRGAASTLYVDGVNGSDSNDCQSSQSACKTIGHAVSLATSGDTIRVAAATYKENLTITFSLTIVGSGARTTFIDGGALNPALNTVITIQNADTNVTLSGLTIQNGSHYGGGGGISNSGVLTISNSSVRGNTATPNVVLGGAIGAGIYSAGTLVINDSTISGNTARGAGGSCEKGCEFSAQGAGIYVQQASLTLNNSTVSGNDAISGARPSSGGAIAGTGSVSINNSTISGNSADSAGGILGSVDGGIYGNVTIQNSIVANNSGGNCGGTLTSKGYNLSSDGSCSFNGPGDLNNTDPVLGPLQNNGGPTQTMSETLGSSPTIDAGNPAGCTDGQGHLLTTDQRGYPRPGEYKHDKRCDMGAYESQSD